LALLVDHLDAVLAMGEDLLAHKVTLGPLGRRLTTHRMHRQNRDLEAFSSALRLLELSITARLLQARKHAADMKRCDSRLKPFIALFAAGTAPLADLAAELGDSAARDFDGRDGGLGFLRSRTVIGTDTPSLDQLSELVVTDEYLLAARIRLGTLLDLAATFLDTLDGLYDLDAPAAGEADPRSETQAVRGARLEGNPPR
jgi:hypothetical protein